MHQQPHTLTLPDLLHELQMTEITFRRRRKALEQAGFPRALPGLGHRWSRRAVLAWINRDEGVTISNDNRFPLLPDMSRRAEIDEATRFLEDRMHRS